MLGQKGHIDPYLMCELANSGKLNLPKNLNNVTRDLILKILVPDPNLRYEIVDIKTHRFFKGMDWEKAARKQLEPPFIPTVVTPYDLIE